MRILKTLALEPMHGYGVSVRIEQMSKGVFKVNAGSLFVALQRLERARLIKGMEGNRKQPASEVLRVNRARAQAA
jgi:PadR family transcriptional regulator PadR